MTLFKAPWAPGTSHVSVPQQVSWPSPCAKRTQKCARPLVLLSLLVYSVVVPNRRTTVFTCASSAFIHACWSVVSPVVCPSPSWAPPPAACPLQPSSLPPC